MSTDATPAGRLIVAVGLGSNLPPRAESPFDLDPPSDPRARALEGALLLLRRGGYVLRSASPLYETLPEDADDDQPSFLNACVLLEIDGDLDGLLAHCESIEQLAGRATKGDLAARPLDLDLIAAWTLEPDGTLEPLAPRTSPTLTLPHPRLSRRAFVLTPLAGVAPDLPIDLPNEPTPVTAWQLLRRLAKGARGVAPGPFSASFPFRGHGARGGDRIEFS